MNGPQSATATAQFNGIPPTVQYSRQETSSGYAPLISLFHVFRVSIRCPLVRREPEGVVLRVLAFEPKAGAAERDQGPSGTSISSDGHSVGVIMASHLYLFMGVNMRSPTGLCVHCIPRKLSTDSMEAKCPSFPRMGVHSTAADNHGIKANNLTQTSIESPALSSSIPR